MYSKLYVFQIPPTQRPPLSLCSSLSGSISTVAFHVCGDFPFLESLGCNWNKRNNPQYHYLHRSVWKTIEFDPNIFQNGFLIEGSETTYHLNSDRNCIIKEIGKWRFDNDKNFCEEYISGKGEELYYRSEKDLKDN